MRYKEWQEIQILPTWYLYNYFNATYKLDNLIFIIKEVRSHWKYVVIETSNGLEWYIHIKFIRLVNDKIPNSIFKFLKSKS